MRRLASLVLLLLYGWTFASPLLAASESPERRLPACCRRGGVHRCAMSDGAEALLSSSPVAVRAPRMHCPLWPAPVAPAFRDAALLRSAGSLSQAPGAGALATSLATPRPLQLRVSPPRDRGPPNDL